MLESDPILTNDIVVSGVGVRRANVAVQGEKIVINISPRERDAFGFLRALCAFRGASQSRP